MTDRPAETYDQWLDRTEPTSQSDGVGWESWVGIAVGLALIFGSAAVLLGMIVLAASLGSVVRWLLGPFVDSETIKRRVSTVWNGVWVLGGTVLLIREHDRRWSWWILLACIAILVAVECRQLFGHARNKTS